MVIGERVDLPVGSSRVGAEGVTWVAHDGCAGHHLPGVGGRTIPHGTRGHDFLGAGGRTVLDGVCRHSIALTRQVVGGSLCRAKEPWRSQ